MAKYRLLNHWNSQQITTSIRIIRTFRAPPPLEFMFLHFIKISSFLVKEITCSVSNPRRWTAKSCKVSLVNFPASLVSSVSDSGCSEITWRYECSKGGKKATMWRDGILVATTRCQHWEVVPSRGVPPGGVPSRGASPRGMWDKAWNAHPCRTDKH